MAEILPAARTKNVTYAIRDIVVKAQALEKEAKRMLYLNIGDPPVYDFDTPQHIKNHLIAKINDTKGMKVARYADSMGLKEARDAIVTFLKEHHNIVTTTDDIVLTTGGSEGITLAIAALVNPGENLLLPCPGYPLYQSSLALFSGEPNYYLLDEGNDWQIDFADLEKKVNGKTRGIVVINPNNPTGGVYTEETLLKVLVFAKKHNLVVFADEIYDQLLIDADRTHYPMATIAKDVPVLAFGGLSKNYVMPGYRVGWIHFHDPKKEIVKVVAALKQILRARLCAPHLQQHAIVAALQGDHSFLNDIRRKLKERRDITVKMLNAIPGIHCVAPAGAFYAFPSVQLPKGISDKEFVEQLLQEEGVVVVYGTGFGMPEQEKNGVRYGHFRVVFLPDTKVLEEAYAKIATFTKRFYETHKYVPK